MHLPDSEGTDNANHTSEQIALAELERAKRWRVALQSAQSEQERIVLLESFVYLLPPQTIRERHPDLFPHIGAVYRAKCSLLERLQQATSLQLTPHSHSDRYRE